MTNAAEAWPSPRATDGPDDRSAFALGLLLRRAHDRALAAVAGVLRPLGLETRHLAVLIALCDRGAMSQSALVEATGSDRATMVRVVDDLESGLLVTRGTLLADRRVRIVAVTERGHAVFDQAHRDVAPVIDGLVAHLLPGETDRLVDLLTRFVYPGRA
ncbi:MarR family transcriptional regulator [Streptomyces sp. NBC_01571]|uniref:MarR family winged helix-turn-helix transcriptional regulator n=1 Tax=Streptomyces sp. NBC_01571 TaxID=2975883 RepID=UPI00224DD45D|nr:MarR family transcriptional regulator [Streptomyces sp. NBC_01571]MCX4579427.1 MarR family transcriptional regulator [Streptomyces sp. NBC_01571]